jgi:hypothetical protein
VTGYVILILYSIGMSVVERCADQAVGSSRKDEHAEYAQTGNNLLIWYEAIFRHLRKAYKNFLSLYPYREAFQGAGRTPFFSIGKDNA